MNVLKPHLQTTIATLVAAGKCQREISRVTGVDRKTIRKYQEQFAAAQANSPTVPTGCALQIPPPCPPTKGSQISACEPHREFIEAQLRLRRNAMAIYQDLVDRFGFVAGYDSVKRFVRTMRQHEPAQFDRLDFMPGEEAQVDYGEGALTRVPGTNRYRKPRLFVMTLRYSRRSFRRVVWKSSKQVWAELHEQAWRHFGGVTQYVVLDNLKEGVVKPDLYEPELNPVYAAMLAHYGVVADPARVRDPNRKGTVENAIQHTQGTALKGRRFESIEEQNAFLDQWESNWAARRIHGSTRRQVQAMFEEERPHLGALPTRSFEYFTDKVYTVCDDTCVRVDHSSYAARPALIGSQVLVRKFARRLEVRNLQTQALLRTHVLADKPGSVVLPHDERPFNPSRETRRILLQAKAIGPSAERLCQQLFDTEGRIGQRKLWGIVGLARRYPRRLIDSACEIAVREGVTSYKQVKALTERLLEQALAELDTPIQGELPLTQEHHLIRDGDDYADLFTLGASHSAAMSSPNGDLS
ncbi:IS21 family transposase [Caballeronia sp. LZ016]|uniref:IS21 family transposase n=1 Tax=Caballeronia sp. LZ016 TaxID=3038554 RepID=UPI0028671F63|nr:IS21 family transposase [Caballeronia sp. LZ016]MDR5738019.1 IS21 family transposase [Caballeronia sp. LZ016]MDR5739551.1 IS21 family transposase [Caballeronia sp. LZ016]MDR5740012.1 IS21 family transposase [Caballeronia sp. LZ016]MDR5740143.1 IS21 family transposase [Caballeronia sp. LZ016]